jgi:hypothetical protein
MDTQYSLEPFIEYFARFDDSREHDVLEISVGLGANQQHFYASRRKNEGVALHRAAEHIRSRFKQARNGRYRAQPSPSSPEAAPSDQNPVPRKTCSLRHLNKIRHYLPASLATDPQPALGGA